MQVQPKYGQSYGFFEYFLVPTFLVLALLVYIC